MEFQDWLKAHYVKAGFISSTDELRAAWDAATTSELRRQHAEHIENQRVIAAWMGRTQRAEAQRDQLLEALKVARLIMGHPDDAHSQLIDAAITGLHEVEKQRDELLEALRNCVGSTGHKETERRAIIAKAEGKQ